MIRLAKTASVPRSNAQPPIFAVSALLAGLVFFPLGRALAFDASAVKAAMEAITPENAQSYVNVLADDSFEGRETGSRGGRAAGSYIAEQFEKLHIHGAGAKRWLFSAVRFQ